MSATHRNSHIFLGRDQKLLTEHLVEVWRIFELGHLADGNFCPPEIASTIIMDPRLLSEVITHALVDLSRMSTFHLPPDHVRPDNHKLAGFVAKWISKIRPITIRYPDILPGRLHKINAHFAVVAFRSFLKLPSRHLPKPIYKSLLYTFHFRECTGETMALIAYCTEQIP